MKKNLKKTFQSILSCITVFTLIVGSMAGGAFAKYQDYTLEELINKAMSLTESEREEILNELTQEDLDRFRNEVKSLSIREKGELVLKLISNDDLASFLREVILTDPSYNLTIEDLRNFIKNRIKDPLERLMLEIIDLSLEEKREAFFEFIEEFEQYIKGLTKENYMAYAIILSEKLSNMSKEEIEKALNKIADYSLSRREEIIYFLRQIGAVEFDLDTTGFEGIAADFNKEITGDSYNDFGIKLIFCLLDVLANISTTPSVRDHAEDPYKVQIYVSFPSTKKDQLNKLFGFLDVFKRRGVTDIDKFFDYMTNFINRHDDMQIYHFKAEVLNQLGKRRYGGTLPKPPETPEPTEEPEEPIETPEPSEDPEEPIETPEPSEDPEEPIETPEPSEDPEEPIETPEPSEDPEEPIETPEPSEDPEEPIETPEPSEDPEEPIETPEPSEDPEDPIDTPEPTEEPEEPVDTPKPTKRPPSGGGKVISTPTPTPSPTPTPEIVEPTDPEVPGGPDEINFSDIDGHWAREIILKLAQMGIVSGYPDGTIRPDASITRAEMSVIVVYAAGLQPAEKIDLKFEDSAQIPEWAAGFIQTAVENGIIVGYEDNTFRASRELSREEMVVLILKAFDIAAEKGLEPPAFLDAKDIGSWSLDYIAKSAELGIVIGYPDNTFKPKKSVTRAEAFVVLYNTMLDRGLIPSDQIPGDEEDDDDADTDEEGSEESDSSGSEE